MPEHADWTSFQRELRMLDTRLEVLQEASVTTEGAMLQGAVLADLETCREELRVAEEELRVQHDELASHFVILAFASTPVLTLDTDELVARITELTQRALAGADAVRVSVDGGSDPNTLQLAFEIDGDDAATDHPFTARPASVRKEAGAVHTAGNRPTLVLPLSANGSTFGTLDVFTAGRRPLSTKDTALAKLCAQAAGAVLANAGAVASARKRVDNLNGALASRAVIEQAKGAIMAMEGCSADEAFDRLRVISQRSNVKLRDVARQLLDATCASGHRHAS